MCARYLTTITDELRALNSGGRGIILATIALGWGVTIGARTIYPVLLPSLRTAYDFGLTASGVLLSVLFAAYALGQLPGGVLADRAGERITLTLSVAVSGIAIAFVVISQSTAALFVVTAAFGFAVGFYAIARFTAIAAIYPDRYGTAAGVTNTAPELGQALLPPIAGFVASVVGWRLGLGFVVPVFVITAVALWVTVPGPSENEATDSAETEKTSPSVRTVLGALKDPAILRATAAMILGVSIWQVFTGFYPTYLVEIKGLSSSRAAVVFGLYFAATAVIHPVAGAVYDRFGVRRAYLLSGVAAVSLAALPFVEGLGGAIAVSIGMGTLLAFETPTESYLVQSLPSSIEGTGFGVLRTTVFAVGAAGPAVFGLLADRGYFDELFFALAIIAVGMILLARQLPTVSVR